MAGELEKLEDIISNPESTLRKALGQNGSKTHHLGPNAIFLSKVETNLKQFVLTLAKLFYGIKTKQLRQLPFKYAEAINIKHKFS